MLWSSENIDLQIERGWQMLTAKWSRVLKDTSTDCFALLDLNFASTWRHYTYTTFIYTLLRCIRIRDCVSYYYSITNLLICHVTILHKGLIKRKIQLKSHRLQWYLECKQHSHAALPRSVAALKLVSSIPNETGCLNIENVLMRFCLACYRPTHNSNANTAYVAMHF